MRAWVDKQVVDPLTLIPGYGGKPSGYVYEGSELAGILSRAQHTQPKEKNEGLKSLNRLSGLKGLR